MHKIWHPAEMVVFIETIRITKKHLIFRHTKQHRSHETMNQQHTRKKRKEKLLTFCFLQVASNNFVSFPFFSLSILLPLLRRWC